MPPSANTLEPIVCVVGFHHARGPEIETWLGVEDGSDPAVENDWAYLPFMALSDGAHASTEDFSYFTLRRQHTSVHAISCTRQIDSKDLIDRPKEVTRSTVQKAVVCIVPNPQCFGHLREKLSIVTEAWFSQRDFTDLDILKKFHESLSTLSEIGGDHYIGLSLREFIHEFKHQTLVLFKCILLQPKMLFFGSRCERLCLIQFALISLVPGLLRHLEDCADPDFDSYEKSIAKPTTLKTSERGSLLSYMGLPLQLFGKGGMFGPYTPLQQLDVLADKGTRSYIVGSTNSLLLQQKDRYSDVLVNLDEMTVDVTSSSLRIATVLSTPDRRWIDFLSQTVLETWDENNPSRPRTMGYMGSEEFLRLQFEEYLLAFLSSVKYHIYLQDPQNKPMASFEGNPAADFNLDFVHAWQESSSFRLFDSITESHLFDIVEPRHPTAGNLSFEDIQRRVTMQIQTLHLDEKLASSRETLNKHFATGQKKVSTAFANLWADIEARREAQRERAELASHGLIEKSYRKSSPAPSAGSMADSAGKGLAGKAPDLATAQASIQAAGQKAGAYMSSWGAWASERRKEWSKPTANTANAGGFAAGETANPSLGRLSRWTSAASGKSNGSSLKEEKGQDGIGRLDA